MELAKIEQLVTAYFEGNTSLEEEAQLQAYFSEGTVAPHLAVYAPLFSAMRVAQNETYNREVVFPKEQNTSSRWWIGIAASAVVALGVGGFFMNQEPTLTPEEQEAIAAFEKTKEAFQLLSSNFNEGAEELTYISKFAETKNKILK